ncbi:MAG: hypothetical protein ACRDVZ_04910 [Jiangellaceae bacterium]
MLIGGPAHTRSRRVDQIIQRRVARDRAAAGPREPLYARISQDRTPARGAPTSSPAPSEPTVGASLELLRAIVGELFGVDAVTAEHVIKFGELISALARDVPALEAENIAAEKLIEEALGENEQLRVQAQMMTARVDATEHDMAVLEDEQRNHAREAAWLRRHLPRRDASMHSSHPTSRRRQSTSPTFSTDYSTAITPGGTASSITLSPAEVAVSPRTC